MSEHSAGSRRLPVILMIDASEGMNGVFQVTLQQGLESLCQALRQDELTSRLVYLATIVCSSDGARAQRLGVITRYHPPTWEASGTFALAAGLDQLSAILRYDLIHQGSGVAGDYAPLIVYALGSPPADEWSASLERARTQAAQCKSLSIALITGDALVAPGRALAEHVVLMQAPDGAMITAFFEWMTEVIATIGGTLRSDQRTLTLPPLPHGLLTIA